MQSASVCAPRPFLGVCSAFANVEVAETTKSEIGQDGRNWLDDLASLPQLDELDHVLLHTSTDAHTLNYTGIQARVANIYNKVYVYLHVPFCLPF